MARIQRVQAVLTGVSDRINIRINMAQTMAQQSPQRWSHAADEVSVYTRDESFE